MNPFDLRGPDFLALYVTVLLLAMVVAVVLRWLLRAGPAGTDTGDLPRLDAYETAYLAGGPASAVQAALASLAHSGAVSINAVSRRATTTASSVRHPHPLEQAVYAAATFSGGVPVYDLASLAAKEVRDIGQSLEDAGLTLNAAARWPIRVAPATLVAAVAVFGAMKVQVGLSRNRPVEFLVVLIVLTLAIAIAFVLWRLHRTRLGDRVLADLRQENAALEYGVRHNADELPGNEIAFAVGLFGAAVLAGTVLKDLQTALKRPQQPSSGRFGNHGGGGSSCGGSTSGGGGCGGGNSSCGGGGGDGGGGCGGCGGG